MNYVVNNIRLKYLSRHPLSIKLYGYELESEFIESVKKYGIICPIQVTQDFIIVDGHRRYQAAQQLGIERDHVIVRLDLDDDLAIQEALIECNRHRDRSDEIKHHEAQVLESIAQERAKQLEIISGRQEAIEEELTPAYEPYQLPKYHWNTLDDF